MNSPGRTGTIEVTITWLEMRNPPGARPSRRNEQLCILRAHNPTVSWYRYLYNTVGEQWLWYERRAIDDHALSTEIEDEDVYIYVLYFAGVPGGYVELDNRAGEDVEIAYFGLVPEFIGRGLGGYFLDWAINRAFELRPARLVVNTCSLDHPRALALYQKHGFVPFRQETKSIIDPRLDGTMPATAAPHVPLAG